MSIRAITEQLRESTQQEMLRRANLQEEIEHANLPSPQPTLSELRQAVEDERLRRRATHR